jgi:hypothetical protein
VDRGLPFSGQASQNLGIFPVPIALGNRGMAGGP